MSEAQLVTPMPPPVPSARTAVRQTPLFVNGSVPRRTVPEIEPRSAAVMLTPVMSYWSGSAMV
jgi:hypothetical protein